MGDGSHPTLALGPQVAQGQRELEVQPLGGGIGDLHFVGAVVGDLGAQLQLPELPLGGLGEPDHGEGQRDGHGVAGLAVLGVGARTGDEQVDGEGTRGGEHEEERGHAGHGTSRRWVQCGPATVDRE